MNWYQLYKFAAQTIRLSREELEKRLAELGWKTVFKKSYAHKISIPPQGGEGITWTYEHYDDKDSTWQNIRNSFVSKFPALRFVWNNPFVIPKDFDRATQSIRIPENRMPVQPRPIQERAIITLQPDKNIEVLHGGNWIESEKVKPLERSILLTTGEELKYPSPSSKVRYRDLPPLPNKKAQAKRIRIIAIKVK